MRNALSLSLQIMVRSNQECSLRFRALVEKLYNLKKISDKTAVNSKDQYDQFLKTVCEKVVNLLIKDISKN